MCDGNIYNLNLFKLTSFIIATFLRWVKSVIASGTSNRGSRYAGNLASQVLGFCSIEGRVADNLQMDK